MRARPTIALTTATAIILLVGACTDGDGDDAADELVRLDAAAGTADLIDLIDPSELIDEDAVRVTVPGPGTIPPPDTRAARPLTADELDVELDENGRPYDIERSWYDRGELVTEAFGSLSVPGGELRIIDGIAAEVDLAFFADEATAVPLGSDIDTVEITLHQLATTIDADTTVTQIGAVRLDVPAAESVDRWEPYEFAYGTDGGTGGVTSQAVIDAATLRGDDDTPDDFGEFDPAPRLDNVLGQDLPDVFVYSNGFGDGAFPMSRGLDRNGDLVSIVLPTLTYPWRLMIADGEPPGDVTTRENEYLECLRGTRPVTVDGICLHDRD